MLLIVYNSEFSEIKIYIGKLLTYWKILIPIVYSIYQKKTWSAHFPITFKGFFISLSYVKY